MGHTGKRIFAPVSIIGDLCPVLPTELTNLKSIAMSAPIDKWSFKKFLRHSTKVNITNAQIADVHCGLSVVPVTKIADNAFKNNKKLTKGPGPGRDC